MKDHTALRVPLGDFMLKRGGSTDPSKYPLDPFVLYSIPAFDAGQPQFVRGSEVGSPKKNVEPGDILLSQIVPHIRRSWIVAEHKHENIIASGEWIVFRSKNVFAPYLRHYLISDVFHPRYMNTVAGVGGSLLRAKPAQVADIDIPLPPLDEQQRIAAILDKADALRLKRKRALQLLDGLTAEIFRTGFSGQRWPSLQLSEVVKSGTIVTYGIVQAGEEFGGGVPYIRTGDISDGQIKVDGLRRTDPAIAAKFDRSRVRAAEIVMSIRATVGTTAIVPAELDGANLTQGTARIAPGEKVRLHYLLNFLRSTECQAWIQAQVKGATFREITLKRLRELEVPIPPTELQDQFESQAIKVAAQIQLMKSQLSVLDCNFTSLQHRAFSGQL